jgi:hypothetical protein
MAVRVKLRRGVRLAPAAPCVFYRHPRQTLASRATFAPDTARARSCACSSLFCSGVAGPTGFEPVASAVGGQRRGPTAACAISLTSCPDSEERTGIRFEKERVYRYSDGAKALPADPQPRRSRRSGARVGEGPGLARPQSKTRRVHPCPSNLPIRSSFCWAPQPSAKTSVSSPRQRSRAPQSPA